MSSRIESVDIAKGIAIICIVLGHLGFTGPGDINALARIIFQFHVPVFFIIAGYFLSEKLSIGRFVLQKARRLLLPYTLACLAVLIGLLAWKIFAGTLKPTAFGSLKQFAIAAFYGVGSNDARLPEGVVELGGIWFLEALFIALVEVRLCLRAGKYAVVPIVLLFLAGAISANSIWLPFNLQSGCIAGLYLYVGMVFKRKDALSKPFSLGLFLVLLTVFALAFYSDVVVSITRGYLGPYWLGLPVSIASSYLVFMISGVLSERAARVKAFLMFFGRNSLSVLCVHFVLLDCGVSWIVAQLGVPSDYNIRFLVLAVVHLSCAGLFSYVVEKQGLSARLKGSRKNFAAPER